MSKEYIISQEELDTLEAIRLSLYTHFVTDDSIYDIMNVTNISEPLWKIINKRRTLTKELLEDNTAYNQGIEDAAKAMEHNSMHCATLIREIKK